jgi:hypothetical protein
MSASLAGDLIEEEKSAAKPAVAQIISLRHRARVADVVFSFAALVFLVYNLAVTVSTATVIPQLFGILLCGALLLAEFDVPLAHRAVVDYAAFLVPAWGKALCFFVLGLLIHHPDSSVSLFGASLFWILTMFYCALHIQLNGKVCEPLPLPGAKPAEAPTD